MLTRNITIKSLLQKRKMLKIYLYKLILKKRQTFRSLQIAFSIFIFLTYYNCYYCFHINLNTLK
jgi:hypothetical protein